MIRAGLLLLVAALGCGPTMYGLQVTSRATAAVEEARTAGAEQAAPYEWTAASELLHKAREEMAHSHYQNALYYGKKAEEHARKATELARQRGAHGAPLTPPPKPIEDKPAPNLVPENPDAPPPGAEENPRPPTP